MQVTEPEEDTEPEPEQEPEEDAERSWWSPQRSTLLQPREKTASTQVIAINQHSNNSNVIVTTAIDPALLMGNPRKRRHQPKPQLEEKPQPEPQRLGDQSEDQFGDQTSRPKCARRRPQRSD